MADLDEASVGENIVVKLTPVEYRASAGRGPMRVLASDAAGNTVAVWTGPGNSTEAMRDVYAQRFDAIFPDLAGKYGDTLYPFFLDGLTTRADLWQADGLHLSPAGYEKWTAEVNKAVRAAYALRRPKPRGARVGKIFYATQVDISPPTFVMFCDDPAHHWVRDTWTDMAPDPRVPMTDDEGRLPR